MVKNPMKETAVLLYSFGDKDKTSQTLREQPFPRYLMIESINKSVREKRFYDNFQNKAWSNKTVPLPLRNKSYDDLFKKLIECCHGYFTSEYGKDENDYRRFVDGSTKIYEKVIENVNYNEERMSFFKKETKPVKLVHKQSRFQTSSKKSRLSVVSRLKVKVSRLGESRWRLKQTMKRGRLTTNRKSKRASKKNYLHDEELEKSTSDLTLSSDDTPAPIRVIGEKSKPFVFKLSDPEMKQIGIAVNYQLPLRIITFPAVPSNPLTYWFQERPEILRSYYPDGNICSQFEKDGSGIVYHKNGDRAISFQFGRIGPLITIYSQSKKIRNKLQKSIPVAVFDLRSNGVVYDNNGRKRLIYDQSEGILIDRPSKVPFRFKWHSYGHIMCRRAELQFVPPTDLKDFDYEIEKAERERKVFSKLQGRRTRTRKIMSVSSKDSGKNRNARKKPSLVIRGKSFPIKGSFKMSNKTNKFPKRIIKPPLIKVNVSKGVPQRHKSHSLHFQTESTRKIKGRNSLLSDMEQQKILKFVANGFIIKPLMTPCSEINNVHTSYMSSIVPQDSLFIQDSMLAKNTEQTQKHKTAKAQKTRKAQANGGARVSRKSAKTMKIKRVNILPEMKLIPQTRCIGKKKHRFLLKPIVMKVTETVSLTVVDQEHIHIDFNSFPMHYVFNLGVKINTEQMETVFDVRDSEIQKEPIPSIFEALKKKCLRLYEINKEINEVSANADKRLNIEKIKILRTWGHNKYLGKIPFCKLLNNKCPCIRCIDTQCVCCP